MDLEFIVKHKIDKMSDNTVQIAQILERGEENAKDRDYLALVSGMKDREVREAISQIRRNVPVLCFGKGYFIPAENESHLVNQWLTQEEHRAKSIFWSMRGAKKMVGRCKA